MQLAAWQITRVPPGGLSLFPTGAGVDPPCPPSNLAVREAMGVTWYAYDGAAVTDHQKLFADGREGWLAHVDGDAVLVKTFAIVPRAAQAPGEAQIEIYANPSLTYVEIEAQGPYETIAPGAALSVARGVAGPPAAVRCPAHRRQRTAARFHPRRRRDRSRRGAGLRRDVVRGAVSPRVASRHVRRRLAAPERRVRVAAGPAPRRGGAGARVARRAARDLHRRPRRDAHGDGGAGRGRRRGGAARSSRPRVARPRCRPASSRRSVTSARSPSRSPRAPSRRRERRSASTWRSRDRCAPTSRRAC